MFTVKLYTFTKKTNSTKQPASDSGVTYNCIANTEVDLLRPVLRFNIGGAAGNPTAYNYCYIPALDRFYWIANWNFEDGIWAARCEVDPLASWRRLIGNQSFYVVRSSAEYDGTIIDSLYPMTTEVQLAGVTVDSPIAGPAASGVYVIGVVCDGGMTDYYEVNYAKFKYLTEKAFSDDFYNNVAGSVDWMAKAAFDPMQYIRSVTYIPFPVYEPGRSEAEINLGWWGTDVHGNTFRIGKTYETSCTMTIPKHPQASSRGSFMNAAPYSSYVLDCRPFGRIVLDPSDLMDVNQITLTIRVDAVTGQGVLSTSIGGARRVLATAQVGQPIQLSQVTHNVGGALLSVAGAAVGVATGNVIGAAAGVGNAVTSLLGKVSTMGVNGSVEEMRQPYQIAAEFHLVVDDDLADRGRPLCSVRQLSTIPGYVVCADPDLQLPATAEEIDTIKSYLSGGMFYE